MTFQVAGTILILAFYSLFFLVGSLPRLRGNSLDDLLLAGRNLPLALGIMTMTATWVGGAYINGTAEAVYDPARGMVWAQAPWGYALSLVLGGLLFARLLRRHNFTTFLDLFEARYGKRVAAILYLPAFLGEIFWSSAILAALGTSFGLILGFDFSTSILLSAAVAIAYTALGGLRSVAYTDALQLACILFGLGIALPYVIDAAGGVEAILSGYSARFGPAALPFPPLEAWSGRNAWGWSWADTALLLVLGGIPWQVYFQRVLACKDEKTAVSLSVWGGIGCLILAVPSVIIGASATNIDWSAANLTPPATPSLVLPTVLREVVPPIISLLGLAAIAAAVMSSVDSSILSAASMFTWNIYRPLLARSKTEIGGRRIVKVAVLIVGSMAALLALRVGSVYTLWFLCSDLVYVILFPQLFLALYVDRVNAPGAVSGAFVGLLLRIGGGIPELGFAPLFPYPMQTDEYGLLFPFRTFSMVMGLLTVLTVSRVTAKRVPPLPLPCARGKNGRHSAT